MSSFKFIHSEIQSVKSKLLIQENTSSVILGKLESLASYISLLKKENIDLKKEIDILRSRSCNHTVTLELDQPNLDIVQEIKERESTSRNIIIFNINEHDDDKHFINNIFFNLNLDFTFKSVSRLGKLSSKPWLIRVELNSVNKVLNILKVIRNL
jgi:hypothetical protein